MIEASPRWCLVIGSLRSGGTERQVVGLANELARRGERVSIAVIDGRLPSAYPIDARVAVETLGRGGALGAIAAAWRLARLARRSEIVYSFLDVANALSAFATIGARARLVWGVRDSGPPVGAITRGALLLCRLLQARPDVLIGNAQGCLDFYARQRVLARRRAVVANGIDTAAWRPDADARRSVREELGLDADAFLVGCVARIDPKKRHDLLLAALAQCPRAVHLVLVGRGTDVRGGPIDRQAHALAIAERVHALGDRRDIARLTAAFDLACCASDYEGFSNSLLEAIAAGVCCVASDIAGTRDVLGEAGTLVDNVATEWSRAITDLACDAPRRARLAAAGRERALERFSMRAMADATLAAVRA